MTQTVCNLSETGRRQSLGLLDQHLFSLQMPLAVAAMCSIYCSLEYCEDARGTFSLVHALGPALVKHQARRYPSFSRKLRGDRRQLPAPRKAVPQHHETMYAESYGSLPRGLASCRRPSWRHSSTSREPRPRAKENERRRTRASSQLARERYSVGLGRPVSSPRESKDVAGAAGDLELLAHRVTPAIPCPSSEKSRADADRAATDKHAGVHPQTQAM